MERLAEFHKLWVGPSRADKPRPARTLISREALRAIKATPHREEEFEDDDPLAMVPGEALSPLNERMESNPQFLDAVKAGYDDDTTFKKVTANIDQFKQFTKDDGLIYTTNRLGDRVLCVPRVVTPRKPLIETVIEQAHVLLGHLGHRKTSKYVRRWYWWPSLGKDIEKYCISCGVCQTSKTMNQAPAGLLEPVERV